MKIIHLTLSAHGGAAIAAARSIEALKRKQVEAELWTSDSAALGRRLHADWWRRLSIRLDALPHKVKRRRHLFSAWSNNILPTRLAQRVNSAGADLVHLHWMGWGFMNPIELDRFQLPIVWTMHDAWPFTGGCHYPATCERYRGGCGYCPQLGSRGEHDLSHFNLRRKQEHAGQVAAWITPSAWLAHLAAQSGTIPAERIHIVPNAIDVEVFRPLSRSTAREALGLPPEAVVIVSGAQDLSEPRKGCNLLHEAVRVVASAQKSPCVVVLFGNDRGMTARDWPCSVVSLGSITTVGNIVQVLSAADLFLLTSLQDNLPNVAIEALGCGCPVVGFDCGGLKEIVHHGKTGWVVNGTTGAELGQAVVDWLTLAGKPRLPNALAMTRVAQQFSFELHGQRLISVYHSVLSAKHGPVDAGRMSYHG